ncbi:protein of unknown function [Pseudorhizobium banfieldiae]|uniref:Uncharacterized protein n=1 Tax=Pseudorhizobium banfieldiae TaxID=1125847 RepID=L0NAV0_9HYPH|nr:protein of unknown function [Pseudorhizobium banfieldiae]
MIALRRVIRYICPKLAGILGQAVLTGNLKASKDGRCWKGFDEDVAWVSRRIERHRADGRYAGPIGLHGQSHLRNRNLRHGATG